MDDKFAYNDYVRKISRRFSLEIQLIEAQFGFDVGNDFEILICRLLLRHLPMKYGVARGSIVSEDGSLVDCDVIVYDRNAFPMLQIRPDDEVLARKSQIPLEAVYAGIETKKIIYLEGEENERNSLKFSIKQMQKIVELNEKREKVPLKKISKGVETEQSVNAPNGYPNHRNPLFTMLFANEVRKRKNDKEKLIGQSARDAIVQNGENLPTTFPDVMILGSDIVGLPVTNGNDYSFPSFQVVAVEPKIFCAKDVAIGIGFITLIQALDWIMLGDMPYKKIIGDAINKSQIIT
jgi:hypothetical protein